MRGAEIKDASKRRDTMTPAAAPGEGSPALVEIGWVVAGHFNRADLEAVMKAREAMTARLRELFPEFTWRAPQVRRRDMVRQHRVSLVSLLEAGVVEREVARWDYAMVVTEADLKGHYKPFALGAPSQAFGVAALSTSRLDPEAQGLDLEHEVRVAVIASRLLALAMHMFGHLNDLTHSVDMADYMSPPQTPNDLDDAAHFSGAELATLRRALAPVADERLEEEVRDEGHRRGLGFALRAAWRGRRAIFNATVEIRPWLFPFLLSRLTTAAVSTLLLLINTAEAWDLGMSQSPWGVTLFSGVTLLGTSAFILRRQRLLSHRSPRGLTEQRIVTAVALSLAVVIGMATTYALLFGGTLLMSALFFTPHLIEGWAASLEEPLVMRHYFVLSAFVASLGIVIGALGAAFEAEEYFRHVAFVDEET